jgi:hypothetical protein
MPAAIQIRKGQRPAQPDFDAFVWGMYLLWASRPSKQTIEPDGFYFIGDIEEAPTKNWTKATPYSLAQVYDPVPRGVREC